MPIGTTFRVLISGLLVFAMVAAENAGGMDKPQRIVSINVCTDQLLMSLVEKERIASLSHLAVDTYTSWIGDDAAGIPLNHGAAEEIIALDPDLVVTVSFSFRPTVAMLRRFGYPVIEVSMASTLEDIENNLRIVGAAVSEVDHAEALIDSFRADREVLTYEAFEGESTRPLFLSYEADGWTTGSRSLVADIARAAGFDTVGDRLGFSGGRRISLEQLLALQPDLVDLGHAWDDPPALVSERLKHPALRALLRETPVVDVPDPLWMCGSLRTIEALARLRRARDRLTLGRSQ